MNRNLASAALLLASAGCLAAPPALATAGNPQGDLPQAPPNTTALSGRVLTVEGAPLPNVVLTDGRAALARTDAEGRFLLQYVPAGKSVMRMDGRHGGSSGTVDYGTYEIQVKATPGRTTELPYTSWLTPIDHANDIILPSPTTSEIVARSPRLPGLELHIPAGTIVTDWDGKRINRISLTPVRADRPPFPLPRGVLFTDYFTAQPGGAKLWTPAGDRAAAKVTYPNHGLGLPGARTNFWHYHPTTVGWMPYGAATVSGDGKSIVPDEGATIYDFMGGGAKGNSGNGQGPADSTNSAAGQGNSSQAGEPVDLASGLFTYTATDLSISDVMPISVTRNYISSDANYRDFGLGMSLSYEMYLGATGGSIKTEAQEDDSELNMITPTSSVSFLNTSPAYGDFSDALFVESTLPGPFLGAQAYWTGNGYEMKRRDGMLYAFGFHSALTYMQDRFGNRVTLTYQQAAPLTASETFPTQVNNQLVEVSSPNGRFVRFTWTDLFPGGTNSPTGGDLYVITKAVDNLGRETDYSYDACGRLVKVLDAHAIFTNAQNYTTLTWTNPAQNGVCTLPTGTQPPLNLLAQVSDQNNNLVVLNDQYEWAYTIGKKRYQGGANCEIVVGSQQASTTVTNGRVCHQQVAPPGLALPSTYSFAYTVDSNDNIETSVVTDPRNHTHKVDFQLPGLTPAQQQAGTPAQPHSPGYPIDETYAADDTNVAQTWTYVRDPVTQTLLQVTAPPLTEEGETAGRVTAFCYDNLTYPGSTAASLPFRPWNLTSVVRNLTNSGNPCPAAVQTGSTTQNASTLFTYSPTYNLVTSITDPNGNTTAFNRGGTNNPFEEALSTTDANSNTTSFTYQPDGQVQSTSRVATASQTLQTTFGYDHNDLVSITGIGSSGVANRVSTIDTDAVGRSIQRIDPLGDISTTSYDPIFGPAQVTDANGSFESFTYQPNGKLAQWGQPKGTTQLSYNQANLLSTFTDPLGAQATSYYDARDNLACTIDRRGNQANFTYDSLNRLSTATYYIGNTSGCSGTPGTLDSTVTYGYDAGNRLLTIADSAGGTITRQYDDLDRLSSDAQTAAGSGAAIGTVAYGYDLGGRMTSMIPGGQGPGSYGYVYDPGNRLTSITPTPGKSVCITYDQADRRTALVYPSSLTANYSWDNLSDETQLAYTWKGSFTPGNPGTCTPGTTTNGATGNLTYGYDQDGRQVARGGTYFTLLLPSPFAANTVAYNADNQQTMWNGLNQVFDPNGNLTCTGSASGTSCTGSQSQALAWDARNRLKQAAGSPALGGKAESYVYDGLSRRQSVTVAAAATQATYLYRGLDPVGIGTVDTGNGSTTDQTNVFVGLGLDERFTVNGSQTSNSGAVVTDSQGSTLQLLSVLTTSVSYTYPPFGSTGAASNASINPFRYTGREASDNTGLYYYRGRYYSPGQSRFVQEDPLGFLAGANLYAYANNDPLNLLDPYGLAACGGSGPQNMTQLLGLILATELAGGGPEDPAADAVALGEIAAYEGGAFAGTAAADNIVLGLADAGLQDTAAQLGGRTLLGSTNLAADLQAAIANPATQFTISLDGLAGSTPAAQLLSAAQRGAAGLGGGYTNYEIAQLYAAGRLGAANLVRGGVSVPNPFGP